MNDRPISESYIAIGRILKPHGVHGEVRIRPLTDLPERFNWLETAYIGETSPLEVTVASVRFHQDIVLLRFEGYNNRNDVDPFRGHIIQVREEDAIPLEEGEYFLFQLEGLQVVTDEGIKLGQIVRIIETGANNVFVVQSGDAEILIPDTEEVVLEIDFDKGRVLVHLLPGLI